MMVAVAAFLTGIAGGAGEPSSLFVVTNSMTQGRESPVATVLLSGQVLISGGQDSTGHSVNSVEIYDPAAGTFGTPILLLTARQQHIAVRLSNGKVLIAGGIDANGNVLNTAEIFDPVLQTSTVLTNTMSDARAGHSATVLPNGQVLIAGGKDAAGIVSTAEIYDPASSQFICVGGVSATPPTCNPSMTDSRTGHTATLLDDGTVLLAGGKDNAGNIVNSAERFTPGGTTNAGSGAFKATGAMSDGRINHSATLLNDGTVLIAGGSDGLDVVPTGEIYEPSTGLFHLTQSSSSSAIVTMTTPRTNHTATGLSDGRVLLAGGMDNFGNLLSSAEVYDPSAGAFEALASHLGVARASQSASLLSDGLVLIAGGQTSAATTETELFVPAPGSFLPNGSMTTARKFATAAGLTTGTTLVAGGENALGPLATTELYDGTTFNPGPAMSTPREFQASATLPQANFSNCGCSDQHVLLAGGVDNTGTIHGDADIYSGRFNVMVSAPPFGSGPISMIHPRLGHSSTVLASGKALLAGGMTSDGSVLNSAELFTQSTGLGTGTFAASAGTMVIGRTFHTATPLQDGTVLLAGGRDTNGNILNSAEIYNPTSDSFALVQSPMNDAHEFHTATALPSGQVLIAGGVDNNGASAIAEIYNPATQTFTAVGRMAAARYFHTAAALPDGEVLIAGGEGNNNLVLDEAEIFNPVTRSFTPAPGLMLSARFGHVAAMLPSGLVLLAGGADGSFDVTASSELYDPPDGPQPAGALISIVNFAKVSALPNSLVNGGRIQVNNLSGNAETFSSVTLASAKPSVFSRLVLTGEVAVKGRAPQSAVSKVTNPGSTATFFFAKPLTVPPGGSVTFTLTGLLASLSRAGASARHPANSLQTVTAIEASRNSGPVRLQGLPASFGQVTLR